jgi:streptogramin lyase
MRRTGIGFSVRTGAALVLAVFAVACGSDDAPKQPTHRQPVHIGPGQIGTIIGTGDRRTDPVDADDNGKVDPAIPPLDASIDEPMDVTVSPDGRLFVLDWNGHKVRALDDEGNLAFVVGTGKEGDACEAPAVDGKCPATAAELNHPTGMAFDSDGRLVIAAWHNSKIKRVDLGAMLLENVCGTSARKFEGDDGPCKDPTTGKDRVSFDLPSSVAFDDAGNLFISDQSNQVVRRLGVEDGIIKTVVGNCPGTPGFGCPSGRGYTGDNGPATADTICRQDPACTKAKLNNNIGQGTDPQGRITFDSAGNLYIADSGNNVVRKVSPGSDGVIGAGDPAEEIITTIAGTGEPGYSGDGGPATEAKLSTPTDVAVAKDGTLYIADRSNNCVRQVTVDGTITTRAGTCGTAGFSGEGELATEAALYQPYGVALDDKGGLYIADTLNHCIRKVELD